MPGGPGTAGDRPPAPDSAHYGPQAGKDQDVVFHTLSLLPLLMLVQPPEREAPDWVSAGRVTSLPRGHSGCRTLSLQGHRHEETEMT